MALEFSDSVRGGAQRVLGRVLNVGHHPGTGRTRGAQDRPRRERQGRFCKAEVGFEPTNNGFAIRPLCPLGYSAD